MARSYAITSKRRLDDIFWFKASADDSLSGLPAQGGNRDDFPNHESLRSLRFARP